MSNYLSSKSGTLVDVFTFTVSSDRVAGLTNANVATRTVLTQLIAFTIVSCLCTFVDIFDKIELEFLMK